MKVKRFVGETAQEALQKVKAELGRDAIILNTRKIRKSGIAGFFSKPLVEVVATIDNEYGNQKQQKQNEPSNTYNPTRNIEQNYEREQQVSRENADFLRELNENIQNRKAEEYKKPATETKEVKEENIRILRAEEKNKQEEKIRQEERAASSNELSELKSMLSKVYDAVKVDYEDNKLSDVVKKYLLLLENSEVDKAIVNEIKEIIIESLDADKQKNDSIVRNTIYKVLQRYIKEPEPFSFEDGKKVVILIGPTGVGKTTTLAKLAANMVLTEKKKVGLITSDTYRIAAVEQLKTYSEIIGVPLSIIYTPSEILNAINKYNEKEIILVDTAGRSHKDKYQLVELKSLINSSINYEVYLVISATTKFSDCIEIIKNYSFLEDYKLLFTKVDETSSLGVILNVAYITKRPISYITTGQSVPDDIEIADNGKIINCILGDKLYERSS